MAEPRVQDALNRLKTEMERDFGEKIGNLFSVHVCH
jgi:hypothetical protein